MIGIYSITNLSDGKRYIGQSCDIHMRLRHHKAALARGTSYNTHMQRAYRKYGASCFSFDVLCECSRDELDNKERAWIDWFKSTDPSRGYNQSTGGGTLKRHSEESRKKMSETRKGVPFSEQHRRNLGAAQIGRAVLEETRQKISNALKGIPLSIERRLNMSKAKMGKPPNNAGMPSSRKGKPMPEKTRLKLSASKKGKPAHNKGKPASEEQKRKQSETMKARWAKMQLEK
jgi:group I intron endonuclease